MLWWRTGLVFDLSILSSSDEATPQGDTHPVGLPKPSSLHCSNVKNSCLMPYSHLLMTHSSLPWPRLFGSDEPWPIETILESSRVKFLETALLRTMSCEVANDTLLAMYSSTTSQYQSCWKSFQEFLRSQPVEVIFISTFFLYL